MDPQALAILLANLRHRDWRVRRSSAEVLGRDAGTCAVQPLVEALDDVHPEVVVAAVDALSRLGDQRAVPALVKLLRRDDPYLWDYHSDEQKLIIHSTLDALGRLADPTARPEIERWLICNDLEACKAAGAAIRSLGADTVDEVVRDLSAALLEDPGKDDSRLDLVEALGILGSDLAVTALVAVIDRGDTEEKDVAAQWLSLSPSPELARLLEPFLHCDDPATRAAAISVIGRCGKEFTAHCIRCLTDPAVKVREEAVYALAWTLDEGPALDAVIGALSDEAASVRRNAVLALGMTWHAGAGIALAACLGDEDDGVRNHALSVLVRHKDVDAVAAIIDCAGSSSATVRAWSAWALSLQDDQRVESAVLTLLGDLDPTVRVAAIKALTVRQR